MDGMTPGEMLDLFGQAGGVSPGSWASGAPWSGGDEPTVASSAARLARESVEAVGRELWATVSEYDFRDCLGDMLERDPPPSFWPLLEQMLLELPPERRSIEGLMVLITPRAERVFGPQALGVFFSAIMVSMKAIELGERCPPRPASPPGATLSFYDPSFPGSLRKAMLGGQKAAFCTMAVIDALVRGEQAPAPQSLWIISTWLLELKLYVRMLATLLGDRTIRLLLPYEEPLPSLQDLVEEGRAADARLEALFE